MMIIVIAIVKAIRESVASAWRPNLPTKITPAKTARLKPSGRFPIDLRIPPLNIKIMLESSPLKSSKLLCYCSR